MLTPNSGSTPKVIINYIFRPFARKTVAYNSSLKASRIAGLLKNQLAWNQQGIDYVSIW